jgi:L-ascorbate metabolism protein UlaG (beta-lactamase superfamily)
VEAIGHVDVLLIPVGGVYSLTPEKAVKTIGQLEPLYAVPMHYKTPSHNDLVYSELKTLEDFLKEYGASPQPIAKLSLDKAKLPEEETQLVVFAG